MNKPDERIMISYAVIPETGVDPEVIKKEKIKVKAAMRSEGLIPRVWKAFIVSGEDRISCTVIKGHPAADAERIDNEYTARPITTNE